MPYIDLGKDHEGKIKEKGLSCLPLSGFNHLAIFIKWAYYKDMLSAQIFEKEPRLKNAMEGKEDLRKVIVESPFFKGCITTAHFKEEYQAFVQHYYNFYSDDCYPQRVDDYAVNYFGKERYNSVEFKDEAYMFVPYDDNYFNYMKKALNKALDDFDPQYEDPYHMSEDTNNLDRLILGSPKELKIINFIDVDTLKHRLKVLYLLSDAMTPPDKEYLRFVIHDEKEGYEQYVIDNGAGDNLMVRFTKKGVFVKGFDHENEFNQFGADEWDESFFTQMFAGVPDDFVESLTEDEHDASTFCLWYLNEKGEWYQNEIEGNDGGKDFLMGYLPESAEDLLDWAGDYYNRAFNEAIIEKLFEQEELSEKEMLELINASGKR